MTRWWLWLTACITRGHKWQADTLTTEQIIYGDHRGWPYTPSSTCTRCGARSF